MATSVDVAWRVACYQMERAFSLTSLTSCSGAIQTLTEIMTDRGYSGKAVIMYCPKDRPLMHRIPNVNPKPALAIVWIAEGSADAELLAGT